VKTLTEMLAAICQQYAEGTAVVEDGVVVRYRELRHAVSSFAEKLYQCGIRPGERVAVLLPNSAEFVRSFFAIAWVGGVVVPLNDHYKDTELGRLLSEEAFSSVITSRLSAGLWNRVIRPATGSCRLVFVEDHPWQIGVHGGKPAEISPDAPVLQQFSSGSTGRPKRISRTHRNLLFELESLRQTFALTPADRFLGVTPFSHVNGLMRSMMASVRAGATLYPLPKFERARVVELIEEHRISIFIGVPFMFGVLAKSRFDRQPDFSSLRLCVSASAPMSVKLNDQFYEKFAVRVRQLYGSTETGTISVDLSGDAGRTLESVGKPIVGVDLRVYADSGEPAQDDEEGEIAVRTPAAITHYENCEALDTTSFRDGYFFTGDLGRKDHDGRIYLTGRKKFFINKGGYKINPREVEELLEHHPKVEEAAVIGVPTLSADERVKAIVVPNAPCTEQEIIEHCRGKIADFKVPSVVEFTDCLPKSPTGKIRKGELLSAVQAPK
jgi:long-chain acyl-CoA synthetase